MKIVTYNLLNFPDALGMQRIDDIRTVINYIQPDILATQEILSQYAVDLILDSVLNINGDLFEAVPFHDGPDTDNSLFYRKEKIDFMGALYIPTTTRDIAEYQLHLKESQLEFYVYSLHLKASEGFENEALRLQEATILRNHLDSMPPGTEFLVMGDFNIYYSDEPAFHRLTDSMANNNGRSSDPLNAVGNWHENGSFAYIHTQSSRLDQLPDGGSGGGLDDRFDMILCSMSFLDSTNLSIVDDSYTACGNDGFHFNNSVNYGFNQAVPVEVANALYYSSDHLPVYVLISEYLAQNIPEENIEIWPNPMITSAQIRFPYFEDFQSAKVTLTNILGQRVYEVMTTSPLGVTLDRKAMPIGIYFVHLEITTASAKHDLLSKLAIIK